MAGKHPTAFSYWLYAMDFAIYPIREVAVIADQDDPRIVPLISRLWAKYRPGIVTAISSPYPEPGAPALLADRALIGGAPTAYVCQEFVCLQPVTDADDFEHQLDG